MLHHSSSPTSGRRARASRPVHFLLTALAFASLGLVAPACGGDGGTGGTGGTGADGGGGEGGSGGGDPCKGGVLVDGVCEGKCTPDKCLDQNTCVDNRCVLQCDSHADCYPDGSQTCAPSVEDDTGKPISTCQFTGQPAGQGVGCPFGNECASWLSCPDGGTCFSFQCGGDNAACVLDAAACEGVENCTLGKCAADGAPCRVNCLTECFPWLECQTKGEADADAYCTKRDCETDADCLAGFHCGVVRDPHEVCGSNPKKGDNNFCGTTAEPCIAVGADGKATDGTSRFEGSLCMLRRSCLKNGPGAPCEFEIDNLDCSILPNQTCWQIGNDSRCVARCLSDDDCLPDARCDIAGESGLCLPRFGAWKGTGKFCEPCLNDTDCGGPGTTVACTEISGGMLACFDQAFPDTCNTDADCPQSPSGLHGTCLDEGEGLGPGDSVYKRCYFPILANSNKTTCWLP